MTKNMWEPANVFLLLFFLLYRDFGAGIHFDFFRSSRVPKKRRAIARAPGDIAVVIIAPVQHDFGLQF
jgi:hypothetical protein